MQQDNIQEQKLNQISTEALELPFVSGFELVLVVLVAFGPSILNSLYPLFGKQGGLGSATYTLHVAISLAFLGYVLRRNARPDAGPALPRDALGKVENAPLAFARTMISAAPRVRLFEWALIVMVAFREIVSDSISHWIRSVDYAAGLSGTLAGNFYDLSGLLWGGADLGVLAYVLYRWGSFPDIGLRWNSGSAALALPLFLCGRLLYSLQQPTVLWLGHRFGAPGWQPPDVGGMVHGALGVSVGDVLGEILNGFHEELIVRGFVMTAVVGLTRKTWLAVAVSVGIQISYHLYQGVPLALSHVSVFTMFALFYARTNSILPVALAHSLVDLSSDWSYGLKSLYLIR